MANAKNPDLPPIESGPERPAHVPADALWIQGLDMDAQGVAHRADGKVVFVEGALPGEWVSVKTLMRKSKWERAEATVLHTQSSQRVRPGCPHFGLHAGACGGCKMQHLHPAAQVAVKQRVLEDNLWHLGKVKPERILRPIEGPAWGYRYRGRLSVRYVAKKNDVLVGFHERKSRYVADMGECHVLPPHVNAMLRPLRALIMGLEARDQCPQIELACGDDVTALVLRHLQPLSGADTQALRDFAATQSAVHGVHIEWWLQPKGPDTVHLLDDQEGAASPLAYVLPEFGVHMPFKPTDFTQVNPQINQVLVSRALRLLQVQAHEDVIDWFCGLGNFTLPLATQARSVLGIEGSEVLVQRAQDNWSAFAAGRAHTAAARFAARNLFELNGADVVAYGLAQKWLVDPPREGAFALAKALVELHQEGGPADWQPPQRIVYVSCNPATLARDAGLLVHAAGYRCTAAGVVNMFPHTAHVESIAVFERAATS
jgi:23S rRNA (uracil1939-C5)-methyltransferase